MHQILFFPEHHPEVKGLQPGMYQMLQKIFLNDFALEIVQPDNPDLLEHLANTRMVLMEIGSDRIETDPSFMAELIAFISGGGSLFLLDSGCGAPRSHELTLLQGGCLNRRYPCTVADWQATATAHPTTIGIQAFSLEEAPADVEWDPFIKPVVLVECRYGEKMLPVFWTRPFFGGSVLTLSLGNPVLTLQNGLVQRLIRRAVYSIYDKL